MPVSYQRLFSPALSHSASLTPQYGLQYPLPRCTHRLSIYPNGSQITYTTPAHQYPIAKPEGEVLLLVCKLLYVALLKSILYYYASYQLYLARKNKNIFH